MSDTMQDQDRFLLVLLMARRVREIEGGAVLMTPRAKDRDTVLALKEARRGVLDFGQLKESCLAELRTASPAQDMEVADVEREELAEAGMDGTFLASIEQEIQKAD